MSSVHPDVVVSDDEFATFRAARHFVDVDDAVFGIEGAGAIDVLQGLLTNDVVKTPTDSAVWGAFLTPKGMIITDAWVLRRAAGAWILVPRSMRERMRELFTRVVPPRLARVTDHGDDMSVRWFAGMPPASDHGAGIFTPGGAAPFASLLITEKTDTPESRFAPAGWHAAPTIWADLARALMGWPSLGREIDERTLPQEVRFDELGGVKYDKGCYTGQETVARLHFRGHANRLLRGICWAPGERPTDRSVTDGEKLVGELGTVVEIGDRCVALARLRREVTPGDVVRAGIGEGVVVDPPFDLGEPAVA